MMLHGTKKDRTTRMVLLCIVTLGSLSIGNTGCTSSQKRKSDEAQTSTRDPAKAEECHQKALKALEADDTKQAEVLLREALNHDLFHGPAHNNLGTILLQRGELYEAAEQFEYARKLLPGHPDPRHNLASTLEIAGRTDDAIQTYKTALEVYPNYLPSVMGLARLQVQMNRTDTDTPGLLREISMRADDQRWRDWALLQIARSTTFQSSADTPHDPSRSQDATTP